MQPSRYRTGGGGCLLVVVANGSWLYTSTVSLPTAGYYATGDSERKYLTLDVILKGAWWCCWSLFSHSGGCAVLSFDK